MHIPPTHRQQLPVPRLVREPHRGQARERLPLPLWIHGLRPRHSWPLHSPLHPPPPSPSTPPPLVPSPPKQRIPVALRSGRRMALTPCATSPAPACLSPAPSRLEEGEEHVGAKVGDKRGESELPHAEKLHAVREPDREADGRGDDAVRRAREHELEGKGIVYGLVAQGEAKDRDGHRDGYIEVVLHERREDEGVRPPRDCGEAERRVVLEEGEGREGEGGGEGAADGDEGSVAPRPPVPLEVPHLEQQKETDDELARRPKGRLVDQSPPRVAKVQVDGALAADRGQRRHDCDEGDALGHWRVCIWCRHASSFLPFSPAPPLAPSLHFPPLLLLRPPSTPKPQTVVVKAACVPDRVPRGPSKQAMCPSDCIWGAARVDRGSRLHPGAKEDGRQIGREESGDEERMPPPQGRGSGEGGIGAGSEDAEPVSRGSREGGGSGAGARSRTGGSRRRPVSCETSAVESRLLQVLSPSSNAATILPAMRKRGEVKGVADGNDQASGMSPGALRDDLFSGRGDSSMLAGTAGAMKMTGAAPSVCGSTATHRGSRIVQREARNRATEILAGEKETDLSIFKLPVKLHMIVRTPKELPSELKEIPWVASAAKEAKEASEGNRGSHRKSLPALAPGIKRTQSSENRGSIASSVATRGRRGSSFDGAMPTGGGGDINVHFLMSLSDGGAPLGQAEEELRGTASEDSSLMLHHAESTSGESGNGGGKEGTPLLFCAEHGQMDATIKWGDIGMLGADSSERRSSLDGSVAFPPSMDDNYGMGEDRGGGLQEGQAYDLQTALDCLRRGTKAIKGIALRGAQIGDEGAAELAEVMVGNTSVRKLDLSWNGISEVGCRAICRAITGTQRLQHLGLNKNAIGDKGAIAIARVLKGEPSIKSVSLLGNGIGPRGTEALVAALMRNKVVTKLNLGGNKMGDKGAKAMSELIIKNMSLTKIFVSDNDITDKGAKELSSAVKVNSRIEQLDIFNNSMSEVGKKKMSDALDNPVWYVRLPEHQTTAGIIKNLTPIGPPKA